MKGIILAGGSGTRLYPSTFSLSKQLIPVYDKPMIYYPLSALMLAGIKDILIISSPDFLGSFENLFQDGSQLGLNISYCPQLKPNGLAEAFILGQDFIGDSNVCLVLGDNIFYGHGLPEKLQKGGNIDKGAMVFGYSVKDPGRYGVVELDGNNNPVNIEEKPLVPKSSWAITGIYFYDNKVVDIAKSLLPSSRGELEITDINKEYLRQGELQIELLGRGNAWFDAGTHQSLLEASNFIATIENRQSIKISCIEEIALRKKFINKQQYEILVDKLKKSTYGEYLEKILQEI